MKFYIILLAVIFTSCRNNETTNKNAPEADSLQLTGKTAVTFDNNLFRPFTLPLNIDTTFITTLDTNDRISFQQIRGLQAEFLENAISVGLSDNINTFCKIDSLKQIEKYGKYVDSLDIGMTKISIAYKIGVIDFKNNSKLFIWGLYQSSYEACPYFSSTSVIGTFLHEGKKNTNFLLAENFFGGDPPITETSITTAKINEDGTVEIDAISISDNIDTPGEETTLQKLILKLTKDKIEIVDPKKK